VLTLGAARAPAVVAGCDGGDLSTAQAASKTGNTNAIAFTDEDIAVSF
jgi:hypothetical protein